MHRLLNFFSKINDSDYLTDQDIKEIQDVNELKSVLENKPVKLTPESIHQAFQENNIQKMKYLHQKFGLEPYGYGNLYIDDAVEEGNEEMAKFLVSEFNCQPSLYAKQMAHINGHSGLSFWMDKYAKQRCDTGIDIHKKFSKELGQFVWNSCIPDNCRY